MAFQHKADFARVTNLIIELLHQGRACIPGDLINDLKMLREVSVA